MRRVMVGEGRRWRKEKRLSLDGEEKTTHTLFHAFLWIYNSLEVLETGDETCECGRSLNNSSQNIFVVYHISLPRHMRLPSFGGAKKLLFCFNPVWQMISCTCHVEDAQHCPKFHFIRWTDELTHYFIRDFVLHLKYFSLKLFYVFSRAIH